MEKMAELPTLKLKVGNHYQNLSLSELYKQWKTDELQPYNFSKAQLTRIKKQFDEFKDQLVKKDSDTCISLIHLPPELSDITTNRETIQPLSDENLDVYTEEDFDTYPIPLSTYYDELLCAVNLLHEQLHQS